MTKTYHEFRHTTTNAYSTTHPVVERFHPSMYCILCAYADPYTSCAFIPYTSDSINSSINRLQWPSAFAEREIERLVPSSAHGHRSHDRCGPTRRSAKMCITALNAGQAALIRQIQNAIRHLGHLVTENRKQRTGCY